MSALFDFLEGSVNYQLEDRKQRDTLKRDGAEWERRQKFIKELEQQMSAGQAKDWVPDLASKQMVGLNANGKEVSRRAMTDTEVQTYTQQQELGALGIRKTKAQTEAAEFEAQNAPMLMQERLATQRASRGYTGALMSDMQRRAANEEADRKLYMEQFGMPKPLTGRAASGQLPASERKVLENDAMFDVMLQEIGATDRQTAMQLAAERAAIEQEADPMRKAAALRRLLEKVKEQAEGGR